MAIYHQSVKTISRSAGRSSTAAAAYRAGVEITDERTGEIHDYTRKGGVESAELVLPAGAPKWAHDRAQLWNAAEQAETRKNSTVAREFEIALPAELSAEQRRELAHGYARELVDRYGFAADVAIHAPDKAGDNRNHHAHILCTTRRLSADGFTEKTRELDERKSGEVDHVRERWAQQCNRAFRQAGLTERVDHRSLEAQGIDREPMVHMGPAVTALERRGAVSDVRQRIEAGLRHRQEQQAKRQQAQAAPELHAAAGRFKGKLAEHRAEKVAELERQRLAKIEAERQRQAEIERQKAEQQAGYKREVQATLAKLASRPDWQQASRNSDGHLGSIGKGNAKVDIYGDSQGRCLVAFDQADKPVDMKGDPEIAGKVSKQVERTLENCHDYGLSM